MPQQEEHSFQKKCLLELIKEKEMKAVLFTPVGGSDPIRNNFDGSILHICRYYRPDVVYLYLSHEMYINHKHDNRYVRCINELGGRIGHLFDVRCIIRDDLHDVQDHEIFYKDFREILKYIRNNEMNSNDRLLINISSGTPAMKSALLVLDVIGEFDCQAIQVTTPLKKINRTDENIYPFEVEEEWRADEDNYKIDNRCVETHSENLTTLIRINTIKELLSKYDYPAALLVANKIKGRISNEAFSSIEQAVARAELNHGRVDELARMYGFNPVPVKDTDRPLVEYLLMLQLKRKKKANDDFIRGISPAVQELFKRALSSDCGLEVELYTEIDENGVERWKREKLDGTRVGALLNNFAKYGTKDDYVKTFHLYKILRSLSKNNRDLLYICENLLSVEEKVRNLAAHSMNSITQAEVKRLAGMSIGDIMNMIKKLAMLTGVITEKHVWDSYDKMNARIEKLLSEELL